MTAETQTATIQPQTEAPAKAAPGIRYEISPLGVITRNGEHLATRDPNTGIVTFVSDALFQQYRARVVRYLNDNGLKHEINPQAIAMAVPTAKTTTSDVAESAPNLPTQEETAEKKMAKMTVEVRKAVFRLRREQGFPDDIEKRPQEGEGHKRPRWDNYADKAERVYLDFLRYEPWEFVRRYGIIGIGEVVKTTMVWDEEEGKRVPKRTTVTAVLSKRKLHITEKAPDTQAHPEEEDES